MNSCNGQQLLVLVAFLLQLFVLGCQSQGYANKCWTKSTTQDYAKLAGAIRIVYRIDAEPNKLACYTIKAANFGPQSGELSLRYKDGDKTILRPAKTKQQKDGSVKYVVQGKEMPLHVEVKPNGIYIIHICNPPRGDQNILVGFIEGKGLLAQADTEVKKLAIFTNPYRVDHKPATCKVPPPQPGGVRLAPLGWPAMKPKDFAWADTKALAKQQRSVDEASGSTDDLPIEDHEHEAKDHEHEAE